MGFHHVSRRDLHGDGGVVPFPLQLPEDRGVVDYALSQGKVQVVLHGRSSPVVMDVDMVDPVEGLADEAEGGVDPREELGMADVQGHTQRGYCVEGPSEALDTLGEVLDAQLDAVLAGAGRHFAQKPYLPLDEVGRCPPGI